MVRYINWDSSRLHLNVFCIVINNCTLSSSIIVLKNTTVNYKIPNKAEENYHITDSYRNGNTVGVTLRER